MIKTILWDVDRTLLDFDAAERAAIQSLFVLSSALANARKNRSRAIPS